MKIWKKLLVCYKTDIGLVREKNEDSFLVVDGSSDKFDTSTYGYLFAVADGLGGHSGGEVASKMACDGLLEYYRSYLQNSSSPESRAQLLKNLVRKIDQSVLHEACENCHCSDMGTTLSALVLYQDFALLTHVGDSRIYRMRNGKFEQLTHDQTMAQLSVELGYIDAEETHRHPLRNVLLEALGQGIDEIETRIEKVQSGDIYLLCSDGLYDEIPDKTIEQFILESAEGLCCDRLVNEALKNGGRDNITVIMIKVT